MALGSTRVLALVAAVVVAAAGTRAGAWTHYDEKKFTVTGTVLCQDCTKNWDAYAYSAKPIPGSAVGITCLDKKTGRTVHHGVGTTDGKGVFSIEVPYAVNGGNLSPADCLVRLAPSGDKGCAALTDFNGGRTGEKPSRPVQLYPGRVTYAVGPYYSTLPQCDAAKDNDACSY
ncbi:uncharacterized protein LOC133903001 [Phragmites australis]|uniref:uncharacterized protein LOC133903001 n=1 Tax=Phragmites australis TaxID=29695 RepID=UPI002D76E11D|nr:uncharacterized protein LOC133903001 [Phragmites australis]